ncbi:uncharacterized protein LOC122245393 [Penaeus japonicus]|uniref:uncharacterized protein LOC122245393 n=1 Tax=Penaeus japonicus TaxID=27405 RepID=UPI001C710F0B|nr:uncharacterized protein LOC122245393 [Penaeus japonicus]
MATLRILTTSVRALVAMTTVVYTVLAKSNTYAKIESSFPPDLSLNFLVTAEERLCNQSNPCLHQCNLQPNCRLVCIEDAKCHMYSKWVGEQWAGYNETNALRFDSCFTSWTNQRRMFPVATNQSGTFYINYASLAVSGYLTTSVDFCSITDRVQNPWWWADLGEPKTVSELVVHIRRDGHSDSQFRSVTARLGNSLDVSQNPVFDSKNGVPVIGSIMNFTPGRPRTGRYLSFHSTVSLGYLTICNIQILS